MADDHCDNCNRPMKHPRLSEGYTLICERPECFAWATRANTFKIQSGISVPEERIADCVWAAADTPFASNH